MHPVCCISFCASGYSLSLAHVIMFINGTCTLTIVPYLFSSFLSSHLSAPGVFGCVGCLSLQSHTPRITCNPWPLTSGKRLYFLPEEVNSASVLRAGKPLGVNPAGTIKKRQSFRGLVLSFFLPDQAASRVLCGGCSVLLLLFLSFLFWFLSTCAHRCLHTHTHIIVCD